MKRKELLLKAGAIARSHSILVLSTSPDSASKLVSSDYERDTAMLGKTENTKSLTLKITFVVEEDNGRFHAFSPAFKGLHIDGETQEKAIENFVRAIPVYISSLVEHGDPLPVGPHLMVHEEPEIPEGAFLGSLTLQWPSLQTSGIS